MAVDSSLAPAGGSAGDGLLVLDRVCKSFGGVQAVSDCSMTVPRGHVIGLIGPNGAGKSSVIDLVSGFTVPDSGTIHFDGRNIVGQRPDVISRRGLIRTFQSPREWPSLTVMDNVLLAMRRLDREPLGRSFLRARALGRAENQDREQARALLDRFGLLALRNVPAGRLSGGQKRLLEFARIAAAEPSLIILDEPMGGVNPVLGERIGQVILDFAADGCTVVLVEHNLPFIEHTCNDVVVMALGTVIAQGPFASLRNHRGVVDAYLGAVDDD